MKKNKKEISIKEMIYSNKGAHHTILAFKDHLTTFKYEGKDYEEMFIYMISNFDYYNEDAEIGRPSDVQNALGYSYSKSKRILKLLFDDIQSYLAGYEDYWDDASAGMKMKDTIMTYHLKNNGEVVKFKIKGIYQVPNVRDSIYFDIINPLIGSTMFVVDHISHDINNTDYNVNIYCTSNFENGYYEWASDLNPRW